MLTNMSTQIHKGGKKKILYIITKSNFGGAQRYVFELALEMKKMGHEVAVACGGKDELVTKLQSANITTYHVNGFQRDINFLKELLALFSLTKIIYQYKPDIVHLNSAKAGGIGSLISRILRVPHIIFTAHGWPFLEPRAKWWKTLSWIGSYLTSIFSHHIIIVSNYDAKHMNMPGIKNKSSVIHTAVSPFPLIERENARNALFSEEIIANHRYDIWLVTNAELNNNKNHTTAIDAVAEFNSTHSTKIFYSIIGSGELLPILKEQVALKGQTEYVNFLGYTENARQYLLAFDIFLLPSKKEGLPYAILEAGLAQIPCIASQAGGISEVISDKESGLLTDPNNHITIVTAFDYLLTNPDKRSLYGEILFNHIKTNFALEKMVVETEAVYNLK